MKKILFTITLLVMSLMTSAQNISYAYDASGNRIKREIILSQLNAPKKQDLTCHVSETLARKTIRIYPNPTKGHLKIEVIGYEGSEKGMLSIVNISGQQVAEIHLASAMTSLDLSSQPSGIYILNISLNGEKSNWKIIKK